MAKPGAEVIVDFYGVNGWWTKLHAKYIFRPITKKMTHEKLFATIDRHIDWLIKASSFFSKIGLGTIINRFLPICDIAGTMPQNLPYAQLRELCVLDTFDMFSPEYDNPQSIETVVNWFKKYGMIQVMELADARLAASMVISSSSRFSAGGFVLCTIKISQPRTLSLKTG